MDEKKRDMPQWLKYFTAACIGAGAQSGADSLSKDSPIHFAVEGAKPASHDGWECGPEGGIIGAPMVCRPITDTATKTE